MALAASNFEPVPEVSISLVILRQTPIVCVCWETSVQFEHPIAWAMLSQLQVELLLNHSKLWENSVSAGTILSQHWKCWWRNPRFIQLASLNGKLTNKCMASIHPRRILVWVNWVCLLKKIFKSLYHLEYYALRVFLRLTIICLKKINKK